MAFVYILKSINYHKTYTGSTVDLDKRFKEHNGGKGTFSKRYMPWKLVYKEEFSSLQKARLREKYFKTSAGRRLMKKILNKYSAVAQR